MEDIIRFFQLTYPYFSSHYWYQVRWHKKIVEIFKLFKSSKKALICKKKIILKQFQRTP